MMRFRLKLIISIVLLISITFSIGGTLLITTSFQTAVSQEKSAAMDTYEALRNTIQLLTSINGNTTHADLTKAISQMDQQGINNYLAFHITASNETIFLSDNRNLLTAAAAIPEDGTCTYIIREKNGQHLLQISSTIHMDGESLLLDACFDISAPYEARTQQQTLFLLIYVIVLFLSILISVLVSYSLTKHLHKLTGTVRKISRGDLTMRSDIRTEDEFGQLSRDFDSMADKLEEKIHALETEAQRQEAFMGAFAHELKTPMTSIIGYADLLRQDVLEKRDRIDAANYVFSEGQRLEKLSFKLLDLLLLEKDEFIPIALSLTKFTDELEMALRPVLERKKLRLICRSDTGMAQFEPDLMKSLLYNLVDNSSKATEPGGIIAVIAKLVPGGCSFQIIDNGKGMEQAELARITEPFYRIDKSRARAQGGAGLGLALCHRIVQLHRGTMTFESTPGHGTRVYITLPQGGSIHEKA